MRDEREKEGREQMAAMNGSEAAAAAKQLRVRVVARIPAAKHSYQVQKNAAVAVLGG